MAWWGAANPPQHRGSLAKTRASNSPAGLRLFSGAWCHLPPPVATCPVGASGPRSPGAPSSFQPSGIAGLVRWVWGRSCLWEAGGLPDIDPLPSPRSFSPVLTPSRRRCGRRRSGGRRRRSGRRSARARASPAHSRSCSVRGLAPRGGGNADGTGSGSLPLGSLGRVPGSPLSVCAVGFVLLPFPFVQQGPGGGAGGLSQWGWGELKWGTPSPEPKHRWEGSGAVPWAGGGLSPVVGEGKGDTLWLSPTGSPRSPPLHSTACPTLNVPPPSWVGWGACHAKQRHEQCCFSQFWGCFFFLF